MTCVAKGFVRVYSCVSWFLIYMRSLHFKRSVHVFPRLPGAGSGCRMSDARLTSN